MRNFYKAPRQLRTILVVLGIVYPPLVYFGVAYVRPGILLVVLLSIVALRFVLDRQNESPHTPIAPGWWLVGGPFLILMVVVGSSMAALKSYPVLVSLGFAAAFGYSLLRPPTIVERIARFRHPDLPPTATPYLRGVTVVWLVFFLANSTLSVATALSGNLALWTLYNGLISYLIMGALFTGELLIRWYRRPSGTRA